jgi:hypothetical protein
MNAVKASPHFDPGELIAEFEAAGRAKDFRVETMGEVDGYPLLAMTKRTPGVWPRIYLSSGIHGDEPAPPAALLEMLKLGWFNDRANWFICPVLNPNGFARGTRENANGIDLNRDYRGTPKSPEIRAHVNWLSHQPRFDLFLCVHEDWESVGYYLYELNPFSKPSFAETAISEVEKICPIDRSEVVDGSVCVGGIVRSIKPPEERELWAEAIYLRTQYAQIGYTLESPSAFDFQLRVAAHIIAVQTIVFGVTETAIPPK